MNVEEMRKTRTTTADENPEEDGDISLPERSTMAIG